MPNKYKINQKVICRSLKCLVIANKSEPYKPSVDVYHRKERFPEKDYLLFILKDIKTEEYFGTLDVYENEIEDIEW
jgi:hypothetical protein